MHLPADVPCKEGALHAGPLCHQQPFGYKTLPANTLQLRLNKLTHIAKVLGNPAVLQPASTRACLERTQCAEATQQPQACMQRVIVRPQPGAGPDYDL